MSIQTKLNMRLLIETIVCLFLVSVIFITKAKAQSAEQLLLLNSNPGLTQQIQDKLGEQQTNSFASGGVSGVPTSETSEILNSSNIIDDKSLITQSMATKTTAESITQRYYGILTDEMLSVYGAAEFGQSQDEQLLFFNTMGKEYRLAAGDVVRVTLRGLSETDATYKIGRDGNIIIPSLAPFAVSGLTIQEAEKKLLNSLQYDDASAAVYITLETARLITVQVSGAVKTPRTIAVPAYTPLSRVLAYTGGIKATGSLRNIILRDREGATQKVDFYNFLQSPIGANDPLVTDSSRVFVGNQGSTVAATGFVARPGIYELPIGETEISIQDLLALTGTTIMPPGMEIEALFFDSSGITSKRKISMDEKIKAGEALDLRFVPTNLQRSISVVGAVLEEYEMASTSSVLLKDLLKNGAVLKNDAFIDFALLVSRSGGATAFSIRDKLGDPDFFVPVDSVLQVFDTPQLKSVVSADPNKTNDPLVSILTQTDVAELYLNGKKIAFIPPSSAKKFTDLLRPFYRITPSTSLNLAIIETSNGIGKSISLQELLISNEVFPIKAGDKFYIFENDFLDSLAREINNTDSAAIQSYARSLFDLFSRSDVIKVNVDQQTKFFIPSSESTSIAETLDFIGFDNLQGFSDKLILERQGSQLRRWIELSSLNQNITQLLPKDLVAISFFTDAGNKFFLESKDDEIFGEVVAAGVSLYVNYDLADIFISKDLQAKSSKIKKQLQDSEIYPLFAIYEYYDNQENIWFKESLSMKDIASEKFTSELKPGARISVFTREFLSKLLGSGSSSGSEEGTRLAVLKASGLDVTSTGSEQLAQKEFLEAINEQTKEMENTEDVVTVDTNLNLILSSSQFIGGAVENPGFYPTSGPINLAQFIAAAGGLTETADITNIKIAEEKIVDGKIVLNRISTIDLTKKEPTKIALSGRFSISVTPLVNEVATGLIRLEGEVQRPGDYLFSRDDTIHELIERAGGLTDVAYPLGAIFTRESLKTQQRASNSLLAAQLEQSVVQVAQSGNQSVNEQIQSVLGYARQLRQQEVTGRMSINILLQDASAPVYLQPGDVLTIPKRPAHVTVIGSVQKDTVASYKADKRLSAYLSAAGGVNRIADLKKIYILLPNGESISANSDSIIPPGSVIVVPPKTDRLTALGLTDLVSRVLGNIATSVLAINNVR